MKKVVLFVFLFGPVGFNAEAADDFQYWSQFSKYLYQEGPLNLRFYAEARFNNDVSTGLGYFFGPTIKYRMNKTLSLGGAAKVVHFKSGEHFARLQRYEGEFFLDFKLRSWLNLQNRSRFEYFRRENRADTKRLRSRFRFTVLKSKGLAKRFYFGNEFFYDPEGSEFLENRFVPLGVNFKLGKKSSVSVFYLIQHIRSSDVDNHVLGTFLSF